MIETVEVIACIRSRLAKSGIGDSFWAVEFVRRPVDRCKICRVRKGVDVADVRTSRGLCQELQGR